MNLAEKVENAYVRLIGNKITAAATLSLVGSAYVYLQGNDYLNGMATWLDLAALVALCSTKCGAGTLHFYRRTEQHIEKYGHLKPRVVELWMTNKTENRTEAGYCQQQGIYLAARKHNQLEAFNQAKEKVSKVTIPHF